MMELPGQSELDRHVQRTSRTFALSIPLLPEPTRREVAIAYLLFRIVDTFEDAVFWSPARRAQALADFVPLLDAGQIHQQRAAAAWTREPPVPEADHVDLLAAVPQVIAWYQGLDSRARETIRSHLTRSARGMSDFVGRMNSRGELHLTSLEDLRAYCFAVAGIVGQMLTDLFVMRGGLSAPTQVPRLRERAPLFGEGLQLVNIVKDAKRDAEQGRVYLPHGVAFSEIFSLIRADLGAATEYVEALRSAGAHPGVIGFNQLNLQLALSAVELLQRHGPGAKLARIEVERLRREVTSGVGLERRSATEGTPL